MPSKRRKAREIALKALYQQDLVGHVADQVLADILFEELLLPPLLSFFRETLRITAAHENTDTAEGEALEQTFVGLSVFPRPEPARVLQLVTALATTFPTIAKDELTRLSKRISGRFKKVEQLEEFARSLVDATAEHQNFVDKLLETFADNWSLPRMASLDRCILRLAASEMLYFPDIPISVTINEAIEMAKKYSTERSSEFINGILDKIKREQKPPKNAIPDTDVPVAPRQPVLAPDSEPPSEGNE